MSAIYVVSARRGFLFLWVLGMGYVILLWHSLSLPYNYFIVMHLIVKIFNFLLADYYDFFQLVIYVLIYVYPKFRKDTFIISQDLVNYISIALAVALSVYQ